MHMPAQGEKSDGAEESEETRADDETPMRLQRVGGEIKLYPHPYLLSAEVLRKCRPC